MLKIVIVGNGVAGLRTAESVRRLGHPDPITVVGAETSFPYHRPMLSKTTLTQPTEPDAPPYVRPPSRIDELGCDFRLGSLAVRLDPHSHSVLLADGTTLPWDRLVIATGVRPRPLPGTAHPRVYLLRTFEDALALRGALSRGRRAVVIGAGPLGSEVAASAASLGLEVDLIEPLPQPMARVVGLEIGTLVAREHRRHGVRLHLRRLVRRIQTEGDALVVHLDDGTTVAADLVVVAVGSLPNIEWLSDSGLELGDGVVCDPTGAASIDGVFAVGDVASMPRGPSPVPSRIEHWMHASDSAGMVAHNLFSHAGQRRTLVEPPYVWCDLYKLKLQVLGRPSPTDEMVFAKSSSDQQAFVSLFVDNGRVTAAAALDRPRELMRCRELVRDGWTLARAMADAPWNENGADDTSHSATST